MFRVLKLSVPEKKKDLSLYDISPERYQDAKNYMIHQ